MNLHIQWQTLQQISMDLQMTGSFGRKSRKFAGHIKKMLMQNKIHPDGLVDMSMEVVLLMNFLQKRLHKRS